MGCQSQVKSVSVMLRFYLKPIRRQVEVCRDIPVKITWSGVNSTEYANKVAIVSSLYAT